MSYFVFAVAAQQNQKIYTLELDKIEQLANINIDSAAKNEIRNALYQGKTVTVHEKPITHFGWTGSGYIVTDNDTGAGAYKISGGSNGGSIASNDAWYIAIKAILEEAVKTSHIKNVFYRIIKNAVFMIKGAIGQLETAAQILWNCDGSNLFIALNVFVFSILIGMLIGMALASIPFIGWAFAGIFGVFWGNMVKNSILDRCSHV